MSAVRVALIGARRRRQGLGPFVARQLRDAGAEVAGFLGTSPESVAAAEAELAQILDRPVRGYVELEALLDRERPGALAILSPHATHERYLEAALAARLPCLCEKPLIWGGDDPVGRARRIVARFEAEGLLLFENCQIPYLLEEFGRLHPERLREPLYRFEMRMSPASRGAAMLVDSLHHPLSVLQALLGRPRLPLGSLHVRGESDDHLRVEFTVAPEKDAEGEVSARVELRRQATSPRELVLGVNGARAVREIREPGYRMFLRAGERAVPVVDPMARLIADFVRALHGAAAPKVPAADPLAIAERMRLLAELTAAYSAPEEST